MINVSKSIKWSAIGLIVATGLIHIIEAPDSFSDAAYKGWLFCANGAGAVVAAGGIYLGKRWGWVLGLAITLGAMIGYIASRTVGLPMLPAEPQNWFEPLGVASLIVEGSFVAVYAKMMKE